VVPLGACSSSGFLLLSTPLLNVGDLFLGVYDGKGLKSFLAAHGDDKQTLINIGHRLEQAYEKAKAKPEFPPFDRLLEFLIKDMSPEHEEYWFRYPGAPYEVVPKIDQCCDVIDSFLDQIHDFVVMANNKAHKYLRSHNLKYDPES